MLSLFLYKNKNSIVFVLLIFLSLFSISSYSVSLEYVFNQVFYTVLSPLSWVGGRLGSFVDSTFRNVGDFSEQLQRMKRLDEFDKENEKIKLENYKLKTIINDLVRRKTDFKYVSSLFDGEVVDAKVVMRDISRNNISLVIDKGESSGITENMPVLAFQYVYEQKKRILKLVVVGKIDSMTYLHSKITPIFDPDCIIHAKVNIVDEKGDLIMEWLGNGKGFIKGRFVHNYRVLLTDLPRSLPVRIGSEVVTSGGQSLFPRGIKIGRIVEDISSSGGFIKEMLVEPYIDYVDVHGVLVIKKNIHPEIKYLMDSMK